MRTPLRTVTFAWRQVLAVRSTKITRTVSQPFLSVTARQVCFDLTDGQTIETPLQGAVAGGRPTWRMPDILPAPEFDHLLAELRHLTGTNQRRS